MTGELMTILGPGADLGGPVAVADSAAHDMAVAHALLRQVGSGELGEVLRVYQPPRRTVVFGRRDTLLPGFPAALAAARAAGFVPAVRATGGRAVAYTEKAVVVDRIGREASAVDSLEQRFESFGLLCARLLRQFGVEARLGAVPGEYCPGAHSVNARGTVKLVGTAQRVVRKAWLFSALVVVGDAEPIRSVLQQVYAALGQPFDAASVGALEHEVPHEVPGVSIQRLSASLVSRLAGGQVNQANLPASTVALARDLVAQHRVA